MDLSQTIIGHFDIAQMVLYLFWIFFFGLIVYLQKETMREGYPLESEVSGKPIMSGPFMPLPKAKTFHLPHGRGEVSVPNPEKDAKEITDRKFALKPTAPWSGAPFEPTGDPLVDGVGPAAWAERADVPDLTLHGDPKIVPLRVDNEWGIESRDRDIRGWPVIGYDGKQAGTIKDLWVDRSEHLFRYVEIALSGNKTVLAPMTCCRVRKADVYIDSLSAKQFAKVPTTKSPDQITFLEEEKVMAYYAGGKLYADPMRQEPLL